jgi:mannan endo-1,4-beta-mannosidase
MLQSPSFAPELTGGLELTGKTGLPEYHGMISVAPGKRYFQDERGQGFVAIGQNDAITWPGLVTLLDASSTNATENYIRDLRAHGINISRVMLEYAQFENGYLETALGIYSPAVVRFWDRFIELAEKHGLYLLLTPYDTFWQVKRWSKYPYHCKDGVCRRKRHWLTDPKVIRAHKARWDFVIRRWGRSPNIFAWDLMNEIDNYWRCTPAEISAYLSEIAHHVRDLEMSLYGRAHLLTVSTVRAVPDGELGDVIYNHPALDFASTHLYTGPGVGMPVDAIEAVPEIIDAVGKSLAAMTDPRPYTDSESGPIEIWIKNRALDREYHHNISWAHLASGAAGSGMRWPYTRPHWLLPEMRDNLAAIARFAACVDWAHFAAEFITPRISLDRLGVIATGCADDRTGILWLLRDTRLVTVPPLAGLTVDLADTFADGFYQVQVWDTVRGCVLAVCEAVVSGGLFRFTLPPLDLALKDVAILIRASR